jgi:hypothetical protein
MKVRLKEDPGEWRKSTWLSALGLALVCSILRWRRVLPTLPWAIALGALFLLALLAWVKPGWFRGFYRVSARAGFFLSQAIARVVLVIMFFLIFVPLGLARRLLGKDALRLKRPANASTYWQEARENSPLDRLF